MLSDLLCWFGGAGAVAAIWLAYTGYDELQARRKARRVSLPSFELAPEHDPEPKRQPGETRVSTAKLDRNPNLRRLRRYSLEEDGANPFRE